MTREQVLDKVEKLLKLSESDNENEAQSAMMMAQKLLAKYHLEMSDVTASGQKESEEVTSDYSSNDKAGAWYALLAKTIAEEMRCKVLAGRTGKTFHIKFIGFSEDLILCKKIFEFASEFVHTTGIKKSIEYRKQFGTAKGFRENYAMGFIKGLQEQYAENKKSNEAEWGLVLVTPQKVLDVFTEQAGGKIRVRQSNDYNGKAYTAGFNDGKSYTHAERIG